MFVLVGSTTIAVTRPVTSTRAAEEVCPLGMAVGPNCTQLLVPATGATISMPPGAAAESALLIAVTGPPAWCPAMRRECSSAAKRSLACFAAVLSFAFLPTFGRFLPLVAASAVSKLAPGGNVSSPSMHRSLDSSSWRKSGLSGGGAALPAPFGAVFFDALTPVLLALFIV